ncbi:TolC family protein [Lysobacter sp. S4-A87]|uniref:TolC family protein n=1 Tax=Lysobacter sp. S4-A87 TaxID=2925843 RepID=UPI001F5386F0|nr:TolC family protein [Lysobacter sp. S4-A87]UNK48622.1 TolC family protein [Lysobacter sp. S4-A87]
MYSRLAAHAALVVVLAAALPAQAGDRLTLDDAFARVVGPQAPSSIHPDLRLAGARSDVLAAERDIAAQGPALVAGAELENVLGSNGYSGLDRAELTLTLASVLERGGKRDARRALAQSRIDALGVEREAARLDLLAETARRYLAVVATGPQLQVANDDIAQRRRTVAAAQRRLQAGASPESVVLTAQAALARAELDQRRTTQEQAAARQHLAALWGEREPDFEVAGGDLLALPEIADFAALAQLLQSTPELARFADQRRIGEARLQLARAQAAPDLQWQAGLRGFNEDNDVALIGGISLPLASGRRAQPQIRAAEAELAVNEVEREALGLALYSTLVEAHGRYRVAQLEVLRLSDDVLPKLARAQAAAERAFAAGAISYLELAQLQSEATAARRQQLDAALSAQRALIEIQRLTGEPLVVAATPARGQTP